LWHESSALSCSILAAGYVSSPWLLFVTVPETFCPQYIWHKAKQSFFVPCTHGWAIFIFQFKVFNALSIIYMRMHDTELIQSPVTYLEQYFRLDIVPALEGGTRSAFHIPGHH